jgi:hypothetical protein
MIFPILTMKHYILLLLPTRLSVTKKSRRSLYFAIDIGSYHFYRAFDGISFEKQIKILTYSQLELYAKQKSLPNIFIMVNTVRNSIPMYLFHFWLWKNRRISHWGIICSVLIKLLTAYVFWKNQNFTIYPCWSMSKIKCV